MINNGIYALYNIFTAKVKEAEFYVICNSYRRISTK